MRNPGLLVSFCPEVELSSPVDDTGIIFGASGALLSLLDDILDLSQIETGQFKLAAEHFSLAGLIDQIETEWQAQEKGLNWACIIDSLPVRLNSDQNRIKQVLGNLLSNAIRFSDTGDIRITVAQTALADDLVETRFRVTDSGPGIAADMADNLFSRLSSRDTEAGHNYGHNGLGLTISKSLVDLMGGQIGYENRPDGGADFWFTVTCSAANA